jgi:hypothetical protein
MFKYALLIGLMLPAYASAADYATRYSDQPSCRSDQAGNRYCVTTLPVEKLITDCAPGVNCHHMQSGQHYSVQSPISGF